MENFYNLIKQAAKDNPNDSQLGETIRHLIEQIEENNAKKLRAQKAASTQIDLEDMIKEIKNGN